jgi:hypothetical protein
LPEAANEEKGKPSFFSILFLGCFRWIKKREIRLLNFPKIVHYAQKFEAKDLKKGSFLRVCLVFAKSRDFIGKNVANFVDSHVRGGV